MLDVQSKALAPNRDCAAARSAADSEVKAMDSKFVFYWQDRSGVRWFQCTNCGALQRGTPPHECPVCHGCTINREEEENDC